MTDQSELLRALDFAVVSSWFYDSNVTQANDGSPALAGDWIWSLAPSLAWERAARDFGMKADVMVNYDHYLELEDYSSLDYRAGGELSYRGGPLSLTGTLRQSHVEGVDRYGGGLTELDSLVLAFSGNYKLSPKTSLLAELSSDFSESKLETGSLAERETSRNTLLMAAVWKATPLLQFGPGFRATTSSSDGEGERSTLGPVLKTDYQLSGKVKLNSRLGLDFVEYEQGASEQFVNASLGLDYRLDALWNFRLSVSRDSEPESSSGSGFRESTALRFGVKRRILAATLGLGVGYEASEFSSGTGADVRPGIDYLDLDTSLVLPFHGERGRSRLFFRYQDSSSDDPSRDWDGFQSGLSISYQL